MSETLSATGVVTITIAYSGANFSGFARQPKQLTVQGNVEEALKIIYRREILTVGAGRTDSGVHALGQVMSFELSDEELAARPLHTLRNSLNAICDDNIKVKKIELKPKGFSARFSAKRREYRYRFVFSEIEPLFLRPFTWWIATDQAPDIQAMRKAAEHLVGEHDFKSFCLSASAVGKSTVREIYSINVFGAEHLGESCVVLQVIGNAFLHSMIRVIAGTMLEVALRKQDSDHVAKILTACDRRAAGQTAPAQGLTFWRVQY